MAVKPEATGRKLNQIIRLLLSLPKYAAFRDGIVTDFKSNMVSRAKLNMDEPEAAIEYRAEGEDEPLANAQTYRLRVEETGTLTVSELTDYLSSTDVNATYVDKMPILQALNIFLGQYTKSAPGITTVGSNKSFSISGDSQKWDLGTGLSALRGFFSSVRSATCRILINVNVSHGAFYDPIPLDQLIRKYSSGSQDSPAKLQAFLKRVRVRVIHLGEKKNKAGLPIPRVKTIFGLAIKDDGKSLDRPPRVKNFGAGSKDVEFFLSDSSSVPSGSSKSQVGGSAGGKKKGKGGKGGAPSQGHEQGTSQGGRFISVYEYFRTGTCSASFSFSPL